MSIVTTDNQNYINIASKLREKTGMDKSYMPSEIPEGIDEVYQSGKQAEYDYFWDIYQNNGMRGNYAYSFYNAGWTDDTYNPKYDLDCRYVCTQMFTSSQITDTKRDLTFAPVNSGNNSTHVFYNAKLLKTIRKLIVNEDVTFVNWFGNCTVLENIVVEGEIANDFDIHYSPLTKDSIISIISALSNAVEGRTATFSLAAINAAFQSVEGFNDGVDSEEWMKLVESKPGWTISLI